MMGRVEGKVVVVTGGASGMGEADVKLLIHEGARVVITDTNEADGGRLANTLGKNALFIRHDVRDEQQWIDVLGQTEEHFGRLDVLVNNAGIVHVATVEDTTLESWHAVNDTSSTAVFLGCKYAIPLMNKTGQGSIINIASLASFGGWPEYFSYVAAKGAIRSMTKAIAAHCVQQDYKIRCNSIHPGGIVTPLLLSLKQEPADREAEPSESVKAPLGRPDDVARLVLFLASDESEHINGAEITVDGGSAAL